ncbi:MAG: hypothetical protein IPK12_22400 [Gemmatimonadetes bacterium]|nr:hypothetical protein [Gemmatimonadota bacterium]
MTPHTIRRTLRVAALVLSLGLGLTSALRAQVPGQAQGLPSPAQAQQMLQGRPDLAAKVREKIGASGLSPEQVRARLRAAGYPDNLLDAYLPGADSTAAGRKPTSGILDAVRLLGIVSVEEADSLYFLTDSAQAVMDSLRADSLSERGTGLKVFGLALFRRSTSLFIPTLAGPVDANYRLGPGDGLVLILTGDVELAHELEVTREGFIAIRRWASSTWPT